MNDETESGWSGAWGLFFFVTLVVALPCAINEGGWAGGLFVAGILAFEALMLALPELAREWERDRPRREQARAAARERADERARSRADQAEQVRRRHAERGQIRRERQVAAKRVRDAAAARSEAEAFYRSHAALLADVLPAALFRAEVESAMPAGTEPEAAWQAARDLIGRMQPLVREAQERRREEERRERERTDRLRDIDAQIRAHEARIRTLRATGPDADFAEDEAAAEREFIEQLREQREALRQPR